MHRAVGVRRRLSLTQAAQRPLTVLLLLLDDAGRPPQALQQYLLDIQPGYQEDPVRGVYNHGWLMGDEAAISADVQSRIDTLLEIQPVDTGGD